MPWQGHHRLLFVFFLMYIYGAKFEDYRSNISRDILDSVFHHFSCTVYYVITLLICMIQNRCYLYNENRYAKKQKGHSPVFVKNPSNKQQLIVFHFIGTIDISLSKPELFSGINSSVCCLFEPKRSFIVSCHQRVD